MTGTNPDDTDQDAYLALKRVCLDNPYFKAMIHEVEKDIKDKCALSAEAAVEAHHEIRGLHRMLEKLNSIRVSSEVLSLYENTSD